MVTIYTRRVCMVDYIFIFQELGNDKPQTQLIAVIHNPVLIYKLSKLDYVNIIEMSKDYLNKVKQFIEG